MVLLEHFVVTFVLVGSVELARSRYWYRHKLMELHCCL